MIDYQWQQSSWRIHPRYRKRRGENYQGFEEWWERPPWEESIGQMMDSLSEMFGIGVSILRTSQRKNTYSISVIYERRRGITTCCSRRHSIVRWRIGQMGERLLPEIGG